MAKPFSGTDEMSAKTLSNALPFLRIPYESIHKLRYQVGGGGMYFCDTLYEGAGKFPILEGSGEKNWLYVGISYVISIISLIFLPTLGSFSELQNVAITT